MDRVTVQDIEELQNASDFQLLRKNLRGRAIGSIVFGLINTVLGLAFIRDDPINVIVLLLGVSLLAESIWLIVAQKPRGIIVDGILLCAVGIWNIFISFYNANVVWQSYKYSTFYYKLGFWYYYFASNSPIWTWYGAMGIIWGVASYGPYRRFSSTSFKTPSDPTVKRVDEIVKSVTKAKASESDDIIEFQATDRLRSLGSWKGKLSEDIGIFVSVGGIVRKSANEVLFARRDDVHIIYKGKVRLRKVLKVSIQIGKWNYSGTISPELMQRYESWKTASR